MKILNTFNGPKCSSTSAPAAHAILLALCIWTCSMHVAWGYSDISGSCNGVYGVHLPNSEGGGDGGYRLIVGPITVDVKGNRTAAVSIQHTRFISNVSNVSVHSVSVQDWQATTGPGFYRGFLLKAFDPYTGLPLGAFNAPLPPNTALYYGCSRAQSAVSHAMAARGGHGRREGVGKGAAGHDQESNTSSLLSGSASLLVTTEHALTFRCRAHTLLPLRPLPVLATPHPESPRACSRVGEAPWVCARARIGSFSWEATREVAFQAFVVERTEKWCVRV